VRAGVGFVRINRSRFHRVAQSPAPGLFDETDIAANLPKAEAAARKLRVINSTVTVEPVVTDIDRTNILELSKDADIILDGTDNFEIRYLINDVSVKLGKPWGLRRLDRQPRADDDDHPGPNALLALRLRSRPAPGEAGTCETAGVLAPIVSIIASLQVAECLKILTGQLETINRELIYIDVWENISRRIKIAPLLGKVIAVLSTQEIRWLEGDMGSQTTSLCGRNAVQIAHRVASKLNSRRCRAT